VQTADIRTQWEGAAPGWARWEATIATWMEPATEAMLAMARVAAGARVLDLASGAGSQTLRAAQRVGPQGTSSRPTLLTRCCTMCARMLAPLL
jgi:predicted methyltransferase